MQDYYRTENKLTPLHMLYMYMMTYLREKKKNLRPLWKRQRYYIIYCTIYILLQPCVHFTIVGGGVRACWFENQNLQSRRKIIIKKKTTEQNMQYIYYLSLQNRYRGQNEYLHLRGRNINIILLFETLYRNN